MAAFCILRIHLASRMTNTKKVAAVFYALLLHSIPLTMAAQEQKELPKSRAELTHYEETSRYEDVMRFFAELQKFSPLIRLESFGHSQEGRELPLVILSDPPISQPREARDSGKP